MATNLHFETLALALYCVPAVLDYDIRMTVFGRILWITPQFFSTMVCHVGHGCPRAVLLNLLVDKVNCIS